tara:strand:- start:3629 stop:3976 length:348 start_codon:yes stop_codon:yes gene_type:complete
MPDSLVSQLFDFGALGIFAGFLIWQHLGMQKRLDKLVEGFQEQIDRIDKSFDERCETIRSRYDSVIQGIRRECRENEDKVAAQRDALQSDLAGIVRDADRKLDDVVDKVTRLLDA